MLSLLKILKFFVVALQMVWILQVRGNVGQILALAVFFDVSMEHRRLEEFLAAKSTGIRPLAIVFFLMLLHV